MNKRKFNEFFRIKTKNNSMTAQTYFNLQYHPTFHSEERLVNVVRGRECALLVYLYYQSKNAEDTIYTVHPSFRLCMYCIIYCYTMHQNYENLNKFPELHSCHSNYLFFITSRLLLCYLAHQRAPFSVQMGKMLPIVPYLM